MIAVRQLTKTFKLYRRPADRLLEWVLPVERHQKFYALRDVNLEIPRGRTVGIVGANGAGKSTLLKLITGVLMPTEGSVHVDGRIAALLELGTGFHPEFTGRQNIYVNGQLLGLSYQEMQALEQQIIDFSELGAFIDQPIRTYSSGMYVRLGFSIAACVSPDVLIVDEALSVGDARFSQKCIRRIREFREAGTTILFVSHDPGAVALLCDEAVLLDRGLVRNIGRPRDVLEEYNAMLATAGTGNVEMHITRPVRLGGEFQTRRHGTFTALISSVTLTTADGTVTDVFAPGDVMVLRLRIYFLGSVTSPTVGFAIRDRLGQDLYGTNTHLKKVATGSFVAGDSLDLEIRMMVPFGFGDYSVVLAVHDDEHHLEQCYEWTDNAAIFRVRLRDKLDWSGLVELDPAISVSRHAGSGHELSTALAERFPNLPDPLTAELASPSPFLFGAEVPHTLPDGRVARQLSADACFVFRPDAVQLALHLMVPIEWASRELRLSAVGAGWSTSWVLGEGERLCLAELPASLKGVLHVFQLSLRGEESSAQCGFLSAHTYDSGEPAVSCPILRPARS